MNLFCPHRAPAVLGALAAILVIAGCTPTVRVAAPEKPIEININIKIEQEVRVSIERDLDDLFQDNPDLFGLGQEP